MGENGKMRIFFWDGILKNTGFFGETECASKLPHEIPGKHYISEQSYAWWNVYNPRRNGGALASGRANSSGAIAIDVASSSTVPCTTYDRQKLEAAAELHTAGLWQLQQQHAAALHQPLNSNTR